MESEVRPPPKKKSGFANGANLWNHFRLRFVWGYTGNEMSLKLDSCYIWWI